MKKVNLKRFEKRGNVYTVSLGNGTIHEFHSLKKTHKFLADTSKFLTRQLYDLREIYVQLLTEYHQNWCYFVHDKKTMNNSFYERERNILRLLSASQNSFDNSVLRSHYANGNHFAFSHLLNSAGSIKECLKQLMPLLKSRSNTMKIYQGESLLTRIVNIENNINNYGYIAAVSYYNKGTVQKSFKQSKLKVL